MVCSIWKSRNIVKWFAAFERVASLQSNLWTHFASWKIANRSLFPNTLPLTLTMSTPGVFFRFTKQADMQVYWTCMTFKVEETILFIMSSQREACRRSARPGRPALGPCRQPRLPRAGHQIKGFTGAHHSNQYICIESDHYPQCRGLTPPVPATRIRASWSKRDF